LGAGVGGSDRIELVWPASVAVKNNWLEINLKANGNTGLSADDAFYFGNTIGNSGLGDPTGQAKTESTDSSQATANILPATTQVFQILDYDKNGAVDSTDVSTASANTIILRYLLNPTGPFAPDGGAPTGSPAVAVVVPSGSSGSNGGTSSTLVSGLSLLGSQIQQPSAAKPQAVASALEKMVGAAKIVDAVKSSPQLEHAIDEILSKFHVKDDGLDGLLKDLGLE
jgi:hypothetical protein